MSERISVFSIVKLNVIVIGWNIFFLIFVSVMIGINIVRIINILNIVVWKSLVDLLMIILFICVCVSFLFIW